MNPRLLLSTLAVVGASTAHGSDPIVSTTLPQRDGLRTGALDGTLWARGDTYKALAGPDGFTYVPFFGSEASRSWPITFRLDRATSASTEMPLGEAACALDGSAAVLDRGPVRARYLLSDAAVEQTFVIDRASLAAGDAALTVRITTDLEVVRSGAGLTFTGPDGSVTFGSAIALDETGRSRALETDWSGETLTFRVPSTFVAESIGDIVVDPVIQTVTVDDLSIELTRPDVAYDRDTNTFCVVYEERFSATDGDIYARTLDGDSLALRDEGYLEIGTNRAFAPRIATIAARNRFVTVFEEEDAFGWATIHTRSRLAATGEPWEALQTVVNDDEFFTYNNPDIGGEAYEGAGLTHAAVVFEMNPRGGTGGSGIRASLIDEAGIPLGRFDVVPALGSTSMSRPAISKFTGDPLAHGAWWIAYLAGDPGAPPDEIHTTRLNFDGSLSEIDATAWRGTISAALDRVDVSSSYESTEGEAFHMTVQGRIGASTGAFLWNRAVNVDAPLQTTLLAFFQELALSGIVEGSLATLQDRVLHSSFDQVTGSPTFGLRASTHENVPSTRTAIGERRIVLADVTDSTPTAAAAASQVSGGWPTNSKRVLVVWHDRVGGGDASIFGALVDLTAPNAIGATSCVPFPNSTNEIGFLAAYGNDDVTTPKSLVATDLPPGAVGYFLASRSAGATVPAASSGRLCLSGSIGRYAGSILNSGALGRFEFTLDPTVIASPTGLVPAAPGETWHFQAWHRDADPLPTSNFTNSVAIHF
ncbi:MAG: hypothetical protein AAF726_06380 [Planctomycetota bacterium]